MNRIFIREIAVGVLYPFGAILMKSLTLQKCRFQGFMSSTPLRKYPSIRLATTGICVFGCVRSRSAHLFIFDENRRPHIKKRKHIRGISRLRAVPPPFYCTRRNTVRTPPPAGAVQGSLRTPRKPRQYLDRKTKGSLRQGVRLCRCLRSSHRGGRVLLCLPTRRMDDAPCHVRSDRRMILNRSESRRPV